MQNKKILFIVVIGLLGLKVFAQDSSQIEKYINTYKDLAIEEMQRTGVPAAIKLAQGIHETLAGTSDLVKESNNHFGIKCKDDWTGESVKHDDDLKNECFRKYKSAADSYRDHSNFLRGSSRYAFLFNLDPTDYKDWAYGLKKAGYATNPKYPQIIIKLIEDYHLEDYTLIAMGKMKPKEEIIAKTDINNSTNQQETGFTAARSSDPVFIENKNIGPQNTQVASQEAKPLQLKAQPKTIEQKLIYPDGEFKINETRVIYAKKGTPFLAIAQQYNISLAWLFDFNDMKESETVPKDQLIYLQRKRRTGEDVTHIVQPGESLYDIAQKEAIRLESLLGYNMLQGDMQPAIGEQLYLRTKAPARPKLALKENYSINAVPQSMAMSSNSVNNQDVQGNYQRESNQDNRYTLYTVQQKETIWSIAQKYNVKIDDLVKWNNLSGHDLKAGQQIKIYK